MRPVKSIFLICFLCISNLGLQAQLAPAWQQQVDYSMNVTLLDSAKALQGEVFMQYTNHSPDTLEFIYIHLWPDAYRNGKTALNKQLLGNDDQSLQFTHQDFRGYLDSMDWKVNGMPSRTMLCRDTFDIEILLLPEPLLPGATAEIYTPFYVKLPSTHISRLGFKDHAYYCTQWYPKPAVYNETGWHPISYLDNGEFFSEYGNFEVNITVPRNFVVAACGQLSTPDEIEAMDTLAAFTSEYKHPRKRKFLKRQFVPDTVFKTLHYSLQNAHDFAWVADPDLLYIKDTMFVEGKSLLVQTFVKRAHLPYWRGANQTAMETVSFFTKELGAYPYPVLTMVDADDITGGDMEYPTLTLINHSYSLEEVIVHEVGHNWLYGLLGSNERDEPWLDEGLNSFYESLFFYRKYPDTRVHFYPDLMDAGVFPYYYQNHLAYVSLARVNQDRESKLTSHQLNAANYWTLAYSKPAAYMWYVYATTGDSLFRSIMRDYFSLWAGHHPASQNLQAVYKKYTGEKYDWLFEQAMYTNGKTDYSIKAVHKKDDEYEITLLNEGDIQVPVVIQTFGPNGLLNSYDFDGGKGSLVYFIPYDKNITWIAVDAGMTLPDVSLQNNYVRLKNDHIVSKPVRFGLFSSYENPFRKHVYYLPSVLYNVYDGVQPGMVFHNYGLLPKRTEWFVMPMMGTLSLMPNIMAQIHHTIYPVKNKPHYIDITFPLQAQSYDLSKRALYYFRTSPQIKCMLDKSSGQKTLTHEFVQKNHFIVAETDPSLLLDRAWKFTIQNLLYYQLHYKNKLVEITNTATLEHTNDAGLNYQNGPLAKHTPAVKLYNEMVFQLTYFKRQSILQLRVFAGTFLTDPSMVTDTRFRLSGWIGPKDYAFQDWYLGRSESTGIFSQQAIHRDGDFKVNTYLGQTNKWMVTANLEIDIPMIYAGIFADAGTYSGAGSSPGTQPFVYDAGLYLRTPDRILQVYFPIVSSSDIANSVQINTSIYWERIRFTLQLQNLKFIRNLRRLFI